MDWQYFSSPIPKMFLPPETRKKARGFGSGPKQDDATGSREVLIAVWTEYPRCSIVDTHTGLIDFNHICRRGYDDGVRLAHPVETRRDRRLFSSPYNLHPICRECHTKIPFLHTDDMRRILLKIAYKKVNEAVSKNLYTRTENDDEFLRYTMKKYFTS